MERHQKGLVQPAPGGSGLEPFGTLHRRSHIYHAFRRDRMFTETWTHQEEFGWMKEEGKNSYRAIP